MVVLDIVLMLCNGSANNEMWRSRGSSGRYETGRVAADAVAQNSFGVTRNGRKCLNGHVLGGSRHVVVERVFTAAREHCSRLSARVYIRRTSQHSVSSTRSSAVIVKHARTGVSQSSLSLEADLGGSPWDLRVYELVQGEEEEAEEVVADT
ncbi:hypothetical protein DOTSEDRAFT_33079 [Dothistroma septosporum NZE10]|uniref:Uncharacterized protein n=1 Tax=Dothistroma septosporum (strain NZE10 / CBS 128990) TaxID=675120 RepID=N1PVP2_DOTSN|nr:hypothetical protein DOTSEDRAFT_33079 [Dothistroma septosporum NZE10]